jgi:hypothetical protein
MLRPHPATRLRVERRTRVYRVTDIHIHRAVRRTQCRCATNASITMTEPVLGALSPRASALANLARLNLCTPHRPRHSADSRRRRGGATVAVDRGKRQASNLVLIQAARPRSRAGAHHRVELHAWYDARLIRMAPPRPAFRERDLLCPMQRFRVFFRCATKGATSSARWRRQRLLYSSVNCLAESAAPGIAGATEPLRFLFPRSGSRI